MKVRGGRAALSIIAVTLCAGLIACESASVAPPRVLRFATEKPFEDVVFELNFAITEQNFRITGRNTLGEGLRERGYEGFPDVEVIHFCNLERAREVLLLDPGFVAEMPCRITVHEQHGKRIISLIMLPEDHADSRVNDFARGMNATLRRIVDFVVETG